MSNSQILPILSVVVPVYNGEKFLEKCLLSVRESVVQLNAGKRNAVEVIVCDNHSNDRTLDIAQNQQFDCVYRVIQTPEHYPNRTLNWRHGLAAAQGTWMMMLHADDLMAPEGLSALLAACELQVDSSAVMISGRIRTFADSTKPGRLRPFWPFPALIDGEALRKQVLPFICPFVPFTVMRRSAYLQVNGLNSSYELVQDWELWIRLLALGDLYYYPQEFGLWRTHGFSAHYAQIFAQEHALLSLRIQELIPSLSHHTVHSCVKTQLAKVRNWLPELSPDALAGDLQEESTRYRLPSLPEARQNLQWASRHVAMHLYWLRLLGGLRLLQSRRVLSA